MQRRDFIKSVGLGALSISSSLGWNCSQRTKNRPNVLVLFTDDQRFNTINAWNNPDIITPNIDFLVRNGTTFTNAYIQGGFSGAVCMPSRAMLLTGRNLFQIENNGRTIPADHKMLPEIMRTNGYRTFGTGKWHNGPGAYARCFTDGGEIMFGGMGDHWNVRAYDFDPTGKYEPVPYIRDPFLTKKTGRAWYNHITPGKHSSELFVDASIEFLNAAGTRNPFFMYVSFMAPHDPRSMPEAYLDLYDIDAIKLPDNFIPQHPFDNGELQVRDELLAETPRQPDEVRRHILDYYAIITHMDAQIGRLLDTLRQKNILENTIIVFAGDNGLALGQHGLMGKQSVYEHSVHVPLLLCGPGIPENEKRDTFCYLFDIFPSLCDLLGLSMPGSVTGKSLIPALGDPAAQVRDGLFFAYKNFQRGYRSRDWKLIYYNVGGNKRTQLFDLGTDPLEKRNLAALPDHRQRVADLTAKMQKRLQEAGDQVVLGADNWGVPEVPAVQGWQNR